MSPDEQPNPPQPEAADVAPEQPQTPPAEPQAPPEASSEAPSPNDGSSAEGAHAAEGEPKKKRRRRRKKKGDAAAAGAPGAETTNGETTSAEKTAGDKEKEKKRPRRDKSEPRERPAFNVGDVVFGKIVELGDDALIIELPGHGRAIFDRAEMALPEEPAQGPGSELADDEDEDDRPLEELAEQAKKLLEQTPADAARPEAPRAEDAPAEPKPGEQAAPAPPPANKEEPFVVTLPPIVLEIGASFVGVVHNDGGRGGHVVLTRHPRRVRRTKPLVALAFKEQTTVKGLVTGVIKGGVEVDVDGLRAFAPASHVELRHGDLRHLIGKRLDFFVTQYGKRGRDVVLSRKSLLEAEAKQTRAAALAKLVPGTVVEGTVRSVVPFGAFIDVGGVEGLVPLSEMSHNRADQPGDVFEAGQKVQVQVQRIDVKGKIWLSRKAVLPDPWQEAVKKFSVGSRHKGKIARIQPFGVFVELEPGVDGLIHTADLSVKPIKHPSELVKVGDEIEVVVASTDAPGHRIALHPYVEGLEGEAPQKVTLHRMVKVQVVGIDPTGLQVRILGVTGRHARGFITAAGTGTPKGTDLRKQFPVGSQHDAKVVDVDPRRGDVRLSIKALQEDTERTAYKQYKQQVSREAKFGTFGDLLAKKLDKPS
jgi:small subunit ribosomal protein S1